MLENNKIQLAYRLSSFNIQFGLFKFLENKFIFLPQKQDDEKIEIEIEKIKLLKLECERIMTIYLKDEKIKYIFYGNLEFGINGELFLNKKYMFNYINNIKNMCSSINIEIDQSFCFKDFSYKHPVISWFIGFFVLYIFLIIFLR